MESGLEIFDIGFYKTLKGKAAVAARLNGMQPVLLINEEPYFVKMHFGILEPAGNYHIDHINLNDLEMDKATKKLSFYYNLNTKSRTSVASDITDFPPGVVRVEIPNKYFLDPVAMARANGRDPKDYHWYGIPLRMYRVAKIIPLRNTEVAILIKNNCERLGIDLPRQITRAKHHQNKRKGLGL